MAVRKKIGYYSSYYMQRLKRDEQEFMRVYDEHSDGIFRYCFFRIFDRELAKDLTQEAFMKTWQAICDGKDIANIKAFVYKVARNLIIDNSRKKKEMSLDQLLEKNMDFGVDQHLRLESDIDGKILLSLLNELDIGYREVIVMRYVDGLTPQEIAEVLGDTPNAVSIRINRGINNFRKLLNDKGIMSKDENEL